MKKIQGIIGVIPINTKKFGITYDPPADRTKIVCELCGEKCWIGPGQKILKKENPTFPVICPVCMKDYTTENFSVKSVDQWTNQ